MKKTSIEVKGAIESREELERAMGEYAAATLALEARKVEMENALREVLTSSWSCGRGGIRSSSRRSGRWTSCTGRSATARVCRASP